MRSKTLRTSLADLRPELGLAGNRRCGAEQGQASGYDDEKDRDAGEELDQGEGATFHCSRKKKLLLVPPCEEFGRPSAFQEVTAAAGQATSVRTLIRGGARFHLRGKPLASRRILRSLLAYGMFDAEIQAREQRCGSLFLSRVPLGGQP